MSRTSRVVAPDPPPHLAELARELPLMLRREVACEVLGLSATTLWRCVRDGRLRVVRVGRRVLVPRASIIALLAGRVAA